jgi:uncharacterized protein YlxW (UPF0749 family)
MAELPSRVTMPLLTLITQQSLDEDYRIAAERRALGAAPEPRGSGTRRLVGVAVVVAIFGLLVSTAFVQTSLSEDVNNAGRNALIERIEVQRDRVDGLQSDIADLRETNAELADRLTLIDEEAQAAATRLQRLEVRTGFLAVHGPGVRVTVDNAPNADAQQIVRDSDLALLANGLWTAGAEAISINGQRLTAMTAIRTSGVAVEINSVGIAPPYTVLAIGDTGTLQAGFIDSSSGLAFDGLARRYGFTYNMDNDDDLSLPAAPQRFLRLRSATTGTSADLSPKVEETGP